MTSQCDESDNFAMAVAGQILAYDRDLLTENYLEVSDLTFSFYIWIIRDGKVSIR